MSPDIPFLQQAFQVVQDHERPMLAQVREQEADALFEGG